MPIETAVTDGYRPGSQAFDAIPLAGFDGRAVQMVVAGGDIVQGHVALGIDMQAVTIAAAIQCGIRQAQACNRPTVFTQYHIAVIVINRFDVRGGDDCFMMDENPNIIISAGENILQSIISSGSGIPCIDPVSPTGRRQSLYYY